MRCLNWRVLAGLAVLVAAVVVVQPQWALPMLAVGIALACPLSMMVLMRRGGGCATGSQDRQAEIAWLRAEIEQLRQEGTETAMPPE